MTDLLLNKLNKKRSLKVELDITKTFDSVSNKSNLKAAYRIGNSPLLLEHLAELYC